MISRKEATAKINEACLKRLNEIYGAGVPDVAQKRFKREWAVFSESDTVFQFYAYMKISAAARRMNIPMITSNGTFIAYLLGYMGLNPLPAHYYCPCCGKTECDNDYNKLSFDLPSKKCSCGNEMIPMGIGIPFECVWGTDRQNKFQDLTIRASIAIIPFAKKALTDLYGKERIIETGIKTCKKDGTPSVYWSIGGFAILPQDKSISDFDDILCWLKDGEPCLNSTTVHENNFEHISIVPTVICDVIYECQNRTGIFAYDVPISELSKTKYNSLVNLSDICPEAMYIDRMKPETHREICRVFSALHSTVKSVDDDKLAVFLTEDFKKYPFIEREDFMVYLLENNVSSDDAYTAYDLFRRGRSSNDKFFETLKKYDLPDDFYEAMVKYLYLFPRFHNAAFLYFYLLICQYAKQDRKLYLSVISKIYE